MSEAQQGASYMQMMSRLYDDLARSTITASNLALAILDRDKNLELSEWIRKGGAVESRYEIPKEHFEEFLNHCEQEGIPIGYDSSILKDENGNVFLDDLANRDDVPAFISVVNRGPVRFDKDKNGEYIRDEYGYKTGPGGDREALDVIVAEHGGYILDNSMEKNFDCRVAPNYANENWIGKDVVIISAENKEEAFLMQDVAASSGISSVPCLGDDEKWYIQIRSEHFEKAPHETISRGEAALRDYAGISSLPFVKEEIERNEHNRELIAEYTSKEVGEREGLIVVPLSAQSFEDVKANNIVLGQNGFQVSIENQRRQFNADTLGRDEVFKNAMRTLGDYKVLTVDEFKDLENNFDDVITKAREDHERYSDVLDTYESKQNIIHQISERDDFDINNDDSRWRTIEFRVENSSEIFAKTFCDSYDDKAQIQEDIKNEMTRKLETLSISKSGEYKPIPEVKQSDIEYYSQEQLFAYYFRSNPEMSKKFYDSKEHTENEFNYIDRDGDGVDDRGDSFIDTDRDGRDDREEEFGTFEFEDDDMDIGFGRD